MKSIKKTVTVFLCICMLVAAAFSSPMTVSAKQVGGQSVTGRSTEQIVFSYLTGTMGLNSAAACGIMANVYKECSFNEKASGSSSYGICQWYDGTSAGNFTRLREYCSAKGFNYQELNAQLHFLEYDLQDRFSDLLNSLRVVSDTAEGAYKAGYMFCYNYERPNSYQTASVTRGNLAKDTFYPIYAGKSGSAYANLGTSFEASVVNVGNQKLMSASNGDNAAGASENGSKGQYWKFSRQGDGSYTIQNTGTKRFLSVQGGNDVNGTNVRLSSNSMEDAAHFYIIQKNSYYYFRPVCCRNTVLTMVSANGWNLQVETEGESLTTQQFRILYDGSVSQTHKYISVITQATEKKAGKIEKVCTVCGEKQSGSTPIPRIGSVELSLETFICDGNNKTPQVVVKDAAGELIPSSNYSVSYPASRKNPGTYTVKIAFVSKYSGDEELTFTIKEDPSGIVRNSRSEDTDPEKQKVMVEKKTQNGKNSGAQVEYCDNPDFSGDSLKVVTCSEKEAPFVAARLKKEGALYVRTRTYQTLQINRKSVKVYSKWK